MFYYKYTIACRLPKCLLMLLIIILRKKERKKSESTEENAISTSLQDILMLVYHVNDCPTVNVTAFELSATFRAAKFHPSSSRD